MIMHVLNPSLCCMSAIICAIAINCLLICAILQVDVQIVCRALSISRLLNSACCEALQIFILDTS